MDSEISIGVESAAELARRSFVTLRGMKQFIGKRHGCFHDASLAVTEQPSLLPANGRRH